MKIKRLLLSLSFRLDSTWFNWSFRCNLKKRLNFLSLSMNCWFVNKTLKGPWQSLDPNNLQVRPLVSVCESNRWAHAGRWRVAFYPPSPRIATVLEADSCDLKLTAQNRGSPCRSWHLRSSLLFPSSFYFTYKLKNEFSGWNQVLRTEVKKAVPSAGDWYWAGRGQEEPPGNVPWTWCEGCFLGLYRFVELMHLTVCQSRFLKFLLFCFVNEFSGHVLWRRATSIGVMFFINE